MHAYSLALTYPQHPAPFSILNLVYSAQVLQHQQQLCRDHEPVALSVEVGVHLLLHSL